MSESLRLARLYMVLLAIFTVGRWVQGASGIPYERAHQVFSIVILTLLAAVFYGAFGRRWRRLRPAQTVLLGVTLGLSAQVVILLATVLSYATGTDTYFNHSIALNVSLPCEPPVDVPLARALTVRAGGLVFNTLATGIAGGLGWALGALLPEERA
jgi:hypothetical protein